MKYTFSTGTTSLCYNLNSESVSDVIPIHPHLQTVKSLGATIISKELKFAGHTNFHGINFMIALLTTKTMKNYALQPFSQYVIFTVGVEDDQVQAHNRRQYAECNIDSTSNFTVAEILLNKSSSSVCMPLQIYTGWMCLQTGLTKLTALHHGPLWSVTSNKRDSSC